MHQGNTSEIYVFRELMSTLAGIEPIPDLTEAQLAAMAGGPALRIEVISSQTRGARSDPSDFSKGPSRLGKTLLDSQLALPLLIQICQQRQACVFKSSHTHTKSLAALFDSVSNGARTLDLSHYANDFSLKDSWRIDAILGIAYYTRNNFAYRLCQQNLAAAG